MIVGISGPIGSGKSTVANHLAKAHGLQVHKFAAPLKNMMRSLGLTEAQIEGDEKEKPCHLLMGKKPRHAMQTLGTEWGRNHIHRDFWVNVWRQTAPERLVADDVRFENEFFTIRNMGGIVIRIERPDKSDAIHHISEMAVDDMPFDHVIFNDGSVADLIEKVEECLK